LRFFHRVGFATGTTATATMVAVFSPAARIGEGIGYLAVFTSIAMVIGPFIGLKLIAEYSTTHLFAACALFGLLAFICGNMNLSRQQQNMKPTPNDEKFCWRNLIEPHALPIAVCGGLLAFVYSSLLGFLPLYAQSIGIMGTASSFFAVYALAIIITRPFIGRMFDRMGAAVVVYTAIVFYLVGMVGLSQVTGSMGLLLAGAIIGLGFGGLNPSFQALAVLAAPSHRKGLATSTYFLSLDIGVGTGSFVLGLLVNFTDYRTMYVFCAAIVAMIAVVFYSISRNKSSADINGG
jgi:MFS family permease